MIKINWEKVKRTKRRKGKRPHSFGFLCATCRAPNAHAKQCNGCQSEWVELVLFVRNHCENVCTLAYVFLGWIERARPKFIRLLGPSCMGRRCKTHINTTKWDKCKRNMVPSFDFSLQHCSALAVSSCARVSVQIIKYLSALEQCEQLVALKCLFRFLISVEDFASCAAFVFANADRLFSLPNPNKPGIVAPFGTFRLFWGLTHTLTCIDLQLK